MKPQIQLKFKKLFSLVSLLFSFGALTAQDFDMYLIDDYKVFNKDQNAVKHKLESVFEIRNINGTKDIIGYTTYNTSGLIESKFVKLIDYETLFSIKRFSNDSLKIKLLYKKGKEILQDNEQIFVKQGFNFKKYNVKDVTLIANGQYHSLFDTTFKYESTGSNFYYKKNTGTLDTIRIEKNDTIIIIQKEQKGDSIKTTTLKNYKGRYLERSYEECIDKKMKSNCYGYEIYDDKKRMIKNYWNCKSSLPNDSAVTVVEYQYNDRRQTKTEILYHLNSKFIKTLTTYNAENKLLYYYAYVFAAKDEERETKFIYNKNGLLIKELAFLNKKLIKTIVYSYSYFKNKN